MENKPDLSVGLIEIGSNSIKSLSAFRNCDGLIFKDGQTVTGRLGNGLNYHSFFTQQTIQRNVDIVLNLYHALKQSNLDNIFIIGTEALRKADNAYVFIDKVLSQTGIDLQILSPEEEAFYAYKSIESDKKYQVIDIGGGSTEIIFELNEKIVSTSYKVGAVHLLNEFKKDISEFEDVKDFLSTLSFYLDKYLIIEDIFFSSDLITYCVGGTNTTTYMVQNKIVKFNQQLIHLKSVTLNDFLTVLEILHKTPLGNRNQIIGLNPDRADILAFGIAINCYLINKLNTKEMRISAHGVRHGYLKHKLKTS